MPVVYALMSITVMKIGFNVVVVGAWLHEECSLNETPNVLTVHCRSLQCINKIIIIIINELLINNHNKKLLIIIQYCISYIPLHQLKLQFIILIILILFKSTKYCCTMAS